MEALSDFSKKTLVVIDPATHTPELDSFNLIAQLSSSPSTYHLPVLFGFDSLLKIPNKMVSGVIVLGSSASPNDDFPWISKLENYLYSVIQCHIPVLGICFGHQLIAKMFNGKVQFLHDSKKKELGWRQIEFSQHFPIPTRRKKVNVFVAHREVVFQAPDEFVIWAHSPLVPIEGLRHRSLPIWTFQCHPEATDLFLNHQKYTDSSVEHPFESGYEILNAFIKQYLL